MDSEQSTDKMSLNEAVPRSSVIVANKSFLDQDKPTSTSESDRNNKLENEGVEPKMGESVSADCMESSSLSEIDVSLLPPEPSESSAPNSIDSLEPSETEDKTNSIIIKRLTDESLQENAEESLSKNLDNQPEEMSTVDNADLTEDNEASPIQSKSQNLATVDVNDQVETDDLETNKNDCEGGVEDNTVDDNDEDPLAAGSAPSDDADATEKTTNRLDSTQPTFDQEDNIKIVGTKSVEEDRQYIVHVKKEDLPKLLKKETSECLDISEEDNVNTDPVEIKLEPAYDEYFEKTTTPKPTAVTKSTSKKKDYDDIDDDFELSPPTKSRQHPVGEFPCVECDYVARRKDKLTQHFQTRHLGLTYKCDECAVEFTRADKLKKHKSLKHGITTVYTCEQCTFNSTSHKEYQTHVKLHPSRMYKCTYCSYFTPRSQRLQDHVERKHEHGAYPCDVCGYIAISSRTLTRHKDSKHSEYEYPCEMCDYKGRRPDHLVNHQRRKHKKDVTSEEIRLNNCVNSDGQYVKKENKTQAKFSLGLKRETKTEEPDAALKMESSDIAKVESNLKLEAEESDPEDFDNDMFSSMDNSHMDSDMLDQIPDEVLEQMNPIEWLMQQGALSYEVKKEYDENFTQSNVNPAPSSLPVKKECEEEKEEEREEEQEEEEEEEWMNDDDFINDDSDDDYTPKRKLSSSNVKSESGANNVKPKAAKKKKKPKNPEDKKKPKVKVKKEAGAGRVKGDGKPLECEVEGCDYTCSRKDKLSFHTKSKHLGLRYPCEICGFQAMRKDKLKVHKERKHFNPQPRKKRQPKYESGQVHYCDKCDYSNLKMRNLQAHVDRVHSNNSFTCGECDFVTTYHLNLLKHTERMHGSKILMCDKCSYTTKDPVRLKYHNEAKHDDSKYPCEYCDYTASLKCELQRHFRRKHRGETYKCDLCDYVGKRYDNLRDHKKRIHEVHLPDPDNTNRSPKQPRRKKPKLKHAVDLPMDLHVQQPGPQNTAASAAGSYNIGGATAVYPGQSVIRGPVNSAHSSHYSVPPSLSASHLTGGGHLDDEKPTPEELSIYVNSMNHVLPGSSSRHHHLGYHVPYPGSTTSPPNPPAHV